MKSLNSLIVLVALAASTAFATNNQDKPVSADADAAAHSDADASAAADAASDADAAASADNTGNTLSTSTTYKQKLQAPNALALASNATAPCFKPRGVGLSAPGAGVGFTGGSIDRDCLLIAAADAELARGNVRASVKMRCATKFYSKALGEECEALLETQERAQPGEPAQPEAKAAAACVPTDKVEKLFRECVSK